MNGTVAFASTLVNDLGTFLGGLQGGVPGDGALLGGAGPLGVFTGVLAGAP